MEDQQARLAAQGGNFTQGRLMGAPTNQPIQGKILDDLMAGNQSQGANLMPIGGTGISAAEMQNLSPERRMALEQRMAAPQGRPVVQQPVAPIVGYAGVQNPAMNQMADYNKMFNQGMQRNQDMNQAAQNLAAPTGPARSFSQVAGGVARMNRMPKPKPKKAFSPKNYKTF